MTLSPTTYSVELRPTLPPKLARLSELADNLMYSWERRIRGLFWRLDRDLWNSCANNPKVFLRRVAQERLNTAAEDPDFLYEYHAALAIFDVYHSTGPVAAVRELIDPKTDLIAYFCAEYGLHESLPVYSGGLGILAGDHCKAASDLRVPLVAVGLFYRQGYFTQQIDGRGQQHALYHPVAADDLPIRPVLDAQGNELRVHAPFEGEQVHLRLWQAQVGHIRLLLLDADVPENTSTQRSITYQLYGGGQEMRVQQEVVLGVGGVRALRTMNLQPTCWHINEGHAAFMVLERMRERIAAGMDFDVAHELVATNTVFTTHTVVPAGHDRFPHDLLQRCLGPYLRDIGMAEHQLYELGREPLAGIFNMTAFAARSARFVNGVSRIHAGVASDAERYIWPEIAPSENPMASITNGVHLPTFLSRLWTQLLHDHFPEWTKHLLDRRYWDAIDEIPYHRFIALRQQLKRDLLADVCEHVRRQHARNGTPEAIVARVTRLTHHGEPRTLVIGFARRFATYKRATLILRHRDRLARLLNDPKRPVLLVFAGKAHPRDEPGQALIRELYEASMLPELMGRLVVVEGYDMHFARNLVQGCDVWLNTPEYPMEACGTSGMKAAMNGVVNVSVLDGWWPEAWDGSNGYAVHPVGAHLDTDARAEEESRQLMDILESQVVPTYFGADHQGWSEEWVRLSKNAMKTTIPAFNSERMMHDYLRNAYAPAIRRARSLCEDHGARGIELAHWKRRLAIAWPGVRISLEAEPSSVLVTGQRLRLRLRVLLNGLSPDDLAVECVFGKQPASETFEPALAVRFEKGVEAGGTAVYALDAEPLPGLQHFRIRAYPHHRLLTHPFEMGRMLSP